RVIGPGIAENRSARRHALTELFRERRQSCVVDSKRAESVPGKRDGDPARVERTAGLDRAAAADAVDDSGQPGASLIWLPEAEEPVSRCQRARPREEEMLNVVQFDHHCI